LGPQMHLNSLAAALAGNFYQISGKTVHVLSVVVLALVGFGIAFVMRKPVVGLIALVACGAAYLLLARWCYFDFSILLPVASPIFTLGLAGLGCFGNRFVLEQLEKARLRRTLERQVSKDLAEHILSMPEDYYNSLPGVRKPVTVLFSDIRGFTSRSEKDDPVTLVSQLREYLDLMGEIVFKHRGVVDKFIGDAVMAVWGNLRSEGVEKDTLNAVAAAVEMQQRLSELNAKWAEDGLEPYVIGIGLNQGHVIFGMMGSEQKQEMTVIGDAVNQAARLEGLTKKFGMEVIVGPRVAKYVSGKFSLRSLGKVRTMGKKEAEELFGVSPENQDEAQVDWARRYHEALAAFNDGNLEVARVAFESCMADQPGDLTTKMYLDAIARGDSGGVLVMTGK
jgi:adenylate cyclase